MDVGDRVKLIKGNPLGKEGVIKSYLLMTRPVNLTASPTGLSMGEHEKYFKCVPDNGREFYGFEDQLELLV